MKKSLLLFVVLAVLCCSFIAVSAEELTMWTIATESDSFHEPYLKAIADFEAANPGTTVKMETFENESYKTKIKSAVAANDLPDIFYTWGGGFSKAFVESGKVLPIDKYYEPYKDGISQAALGNATYDSKLYGVSYVTPVSLMFYNKKMFDERGLKAPESFDDLVAVCQKFIDDGITPIGVSVKDTWVLAMTHDAFTLKSVGPEKLTSVLTKQGGSYNDPDFIAASADLKKLIDMGAFVDSATGISNDEACQLFYTGKVAMYTTGSWMAGSIASDAANPEDFDCAPVPVLNDKNAKITDFMGGAADTLMVSASTKNPDLAAKAAFEIARGVSKYAFLSGAGVPAWKVDYDTASVSAMSQKIASYTKNATSFTLWFDTLMQAEDANEYLTMLQELYAGDLTPEDFAAAMDKQLTSSK